MEISSALQAPSVVEVLDYENILKRMKEELSRHDPSFNAFLESDPAIKILEIVAWREMLLRQRINEAACANLLLYAKHTDLDHLGLFYGVIRHTQEEDEMLRQRIKAKITGWSTAGSREHYRYHALSSDVLVKDARVESFYPGEVTISILSGETDGHPSEALLEKVRTHMLNEDIKMLTDTVRVTGCGIVTIAVRAEITLYPSSPSVLIEKAKEQFQEAFKRVKSLGWDVSRSWIIAKLFVEGIQSIDLIEPKEDIKIRDDESSALGSLDLIIKGRTW